MPKILSYTPAWLTHPSMGHEIFTPSSSTYETPVSQLKYTNGSMKDANKPGPRRTIAHRGSEVFVAVGKQIRWADLVNVQAMHETQQDERLKKIAKGKYTEDDTRFDALAGDCYMILKTPVADDIRQLIISPRGDYLAILTRHTVHIAVIPDSSRLTEPDRTPMRLKTFTLGPITHVTSQSPIASALWHPLGVRGTCLVTVTESAIVRVWEISTADRSSFDKPTLVIDLKKLADGTSLDQDFSASKFGSSTTFSPDSVEMEVASACFGGRNTGGWSPMTLWVAMREGDVYALCPLLPEKWAPPAALIESLSVSTTTRMAMMESDADYSDDEKRLAHQQFEWMADLDNQEPTYSEGLDGDELVYTRPSKPGRIPKLQGPFYFELAPEESDDGLDELLTDIYVIGSKFDYSALTAGEEFDLVHEDQDEGGLSVNVVCVLAASGRIFISLDIDGVEAQWLPTRKQKQAFYVMPKPPPTLVTYQAIDTLRAKERFEENWPVFSLDVASRYSFFVTNWASVTHISLSAWVFRLESEISDGVTEGVDFRLNLLANGQNFDRERLISEGFSKDVPALAAAVNIRDPDLGYFLLTNAGKGPISLTLEDPEDNFNPKKLLDSSFEQDSDTDESPLQLVAPRQIYEPPSAFKQPTRVPTFLEALSHSRNKKILKETIRLSPATLTVFADAHKLLSEETYRIGNAAAELFRRCEKLQLDLKEQIMKANDVALRVEQVVGEDNDLEDDEDYLSVNERIEQRIVKAQTKQKELQERLERIRKKAGKSGKRELSDKEKVFFEELNELNKSVSKDAEAETLPGKPRVRKIALWRRLDVVANEMEAAMEMVKEVEKRTQGKELESASVPSELRKEKVGQVMGLIERETALVEGVKSRLERLNLEYN